MVYNTELLTQRPFGLKVRVAIIDLVARALGMLVHIEGFPYGSGRNRPAIVRRVSGLSAYQAACDESQNNGAPSVSAVRSELGIRSI